MNTFNVPETVDHKTIEVDANTRNNARVLMAWLRDESQHQRDAGKKAIRLQLDPGTSELLYVLLSKLA